LSDNKKEVEKLNNYHKKRFSQRGVSKKESSLLTILAEKATVFFTFISILAIIVAILSLIVAIRTLIVQFEGFKKVSSGIEALQLHPIQIEVTAKESSEIEYATEMNISLPFRQIDVRAVITNTVHLRKIL
jgi:hypothetical protein